MAPWSGSSEAECCFFQRHIFGILVYRSNQLQKQGADILLFMRAEDITVITLH